MKIFKSGLLVAAIFISACGGGGGDSTPPQNTQGPYNIGGNVSGLNGSGLQLQVNGSETVDIASDGSYQFPTALQDGDSYSVVVSSDPQNLSQLCGVFNSSGSIAGADVNNIDVQCDTNSFFIGGAVTGLAGENLELTINNTEALTLDNDGTFQFPSNLLDGSAYSVSVSAQPQTISQQCQVTNGVGTLAGSSISNVQVQCITDTFVIGGTVSGLRSASFELSNAGIEDLIINNDGSFQFVNPVESGSDYSLTVLTQPTDPDQTCFVTNAAGTVTDSDVRNINITCRSIAAISVDTGHNNSCVILEDDSLKCWGENFFGQLGKNDQFHRGNEPDEMGNDLTRTFLSLSAVVSHVSVGKHTCAIFDNNRLKCWGSNSHGQLGLEHDLAIGDDAAEMISLSDVDVGSDRSAQQVEVGRTHTCVVMDSSQVKCWGNGGNGRLGLGDTFNRGTQVNEMGDSLPFLDLGSVNYRVQQLAVGARHTCALFSDNRVKCWGDNARGKLGYEDQETRGDEPGEMGFNLPFVDLGTGLSATQITTGLDHTCALLNTGNVKCWGWNINGQVGIESSESIIGWMPDEMGDNLPTVDLGPFTATQITAGDQHSCALLNTGQVKCWGLNDNGQLGLGDVVSRGMFNNQMGTSLPLVELGTNRTAISIKAGRNHTCALLDNDDVKCWGDNFAGQLGQENEVSLGVSPDQMGDVLLPIDLGSP